MVFFIFKNSFLYKKWLYSLFSPEFLVVEGLAIRILPKVGDFVDTIYQTLIQHVFILLDFFFLWFMFFKEIKN